MPQNLGKTPVEWLKRRVYDRHDAVQNPLAPCCCVLGEDTLRHFPLLDGLGSSFKLQTDRNSLVLRKQVRVIAYPMR